MKKVYFTIVGMQFNHGDWFFEEGMKVKLIKEPDNKYDSEAIRVEVKGLGKVGYVANSPRTVAGDSMSAGRLYDKIGDKAKGKVLHILGNGVLCTLDKKYLNASKHTKKSKH
ncbi:MAG: HIRAN domain-containing protein [Coriobacteriales bacterium]|nr:HIRAN domain-containing protein [Coriobacteriales bacterium]